MKVSDVQNEMCNRFPVVEVIWEDAHSTMGWVPPEGVDDFVKADEGIVVDVGYLLEETEEHVLLATKISAGGQFGGLMKIPRTWCKITKIR